MNQVILLENEKRFLELVFQQIRKINPLAIYDVQYFPSLLRVQIQSSIDYRSKIFNKLHHLHSIFGLAFESTQLLRRDKTLISFDLKL